MFWSSLRGPQRKRRNPGWPLQVNRNCLKSSFQSSTPPLTGMMRRSVMAVSDMFGGLMQNGCQNTWRVV